MIGFAPSFTFSECSITSLGTPGMSDGFHAKMSWFARRKVMSSDCYLGSSPVPTRAVLAWSDGSSWIFMVLASGWIPDLVAFLAGTSLS